MPRDITDVLPVGAGPVHRRYAACSALRADCVAQRRTNCYARAMGRVIPQRELRNQNAAVIAAVAAGESFVVTRNGTPVAEVRPVTTGRRRFVPKADVLAAIAASGHIDSARFRADLDRVIESSL